MKRVVLRDYQEKAAQEAVAASDNFLINALGQENPSSLVASVNLALIRFSFFLIQEN